MFSSLKLFKDFGFEMYWNGVERDHDTPSYKEYTGKLGTHISSNIQQALTARIIKRLDGGQPEIEVARKMKALEGLLPQVQSSAAVWLDLISDRGSLEVDLNNAIKICQKVVDVRGMG